jgi:TRAP-type mannitol/chloroaromatic compound transport system permease large subunit
MRYAVFPAFVLCFLLAGTIFFRLASGWLTLALGEEGA